MEENDDDDDDDDVEKYSTAGQAIDDNVVHANCMLDT
jgi:hypothetical protein